MYGTCVVIMLYIQCCIGLRRHKANAAQQSIAHGLLTRFRLLCVDNLGRSGLAAAAARLAAAPPRGCAGLTAACTPLVAARAADGADAALRPLPARPRVAGCRGPELTTSDAAPPNCSDAQPLAIGSPLSGLPSCIILQHAVKPEIGGVGGEGNEAAQHNGRRQYICASAAQQSVEKSLNVIEKEKK